MNKIAIVVALVMLAVVVGWIIVGSSPAELLDIGPGIGGGPDGAPSLL